MRRHQIGVRTSTTGVALTANPAAIIGRLGWARNNMLRLIMALALVCAARASHAQTVLATTAGPLEIVGLMQWSVAQLQDSLAKYAPGESLQSHACAAVLQRLGFPAVAVTLFQAAEKSGDSTIVTIVEPWLASQVQFRVVGTSRRLARESPRWRALYARYPTGSFRSNDANDLIRFAALVRRNGLDSAVRMWKQRRDTVAVLPRYHAFLQLADATQLDQAARQLASGTVQDRLLGTALLVQHAADDRAWHLVMRALRDPDPGVRGVARSVLLWLRLDYARRVNWTGATADVRALLGGTNVWVFVDVMATLVATHVSPSLAAPLLAQNGTMVLAHVHAQFPQASVPATMLLQQLSDQRTITGAGWEAWIVSLLRPPRRA